jgi:hypothetical protein
VLSGHTFFPGVNLLLVYLSVFMPHDFRVGPIISVL